MFYRFVAISPTACINKTATNMSAYASAYRLSLSAFSAVGGSALATVCTHPLNNFYTLMVTSPRNMNTLIEQIKQKPTVLSHGFWETLALRSVSQGGALGLASYLTHVGVNPIGAATLGGTYDALICSVIDLINVRKVTEQAALSYRDIPVPK
jgi:hypothetical protein